MEIESAITQFFGDILRPIVSTAVEEALYKKIPTPSTDDAHVNSGNIKIEKNGRSTLVHKNKLLADLDAGNLRLRKDKHRR